MKRMIFMLVLLGLVATAHRVEDKVSERDLRGAWLTEMDGNQLVWINSGNYFAGAIYNLKDKKFVGTAGGSWKIEGDEFVEVLEFNTMEPDKVGDTIRSRVSIRNNTLVTTIPSGKEEIWTRIDDGTPGKLEGAWLITGRYRDGEVQKRVPGARKTMKILSGTRFQWIAYNVDTHEFFGTGGGTYTTKDGKYIENIEFFSRDSTRVGASLEFNYEIMKDGDWRHFGKSSKGDPLDENWTKREVLDQK